MTKTTFPRLFFLLLLTCLPVASVFAQGSDIITVRKQNGRTIKSFTRGSYIEFIDPAGQNVKGVIQWIYNDSVFIGQPDIRKYYTETGGVIFDTIGTWNKAYHYKELLSIRINRHKNSFINFAGSALMVGSAGYALLNVINGAYLDEPITDKENIQTLGIAVGVFGAGLALKKIFPRNPYTKRHHQILYIRMTK
jgi:hypothetical protein